MSRKATIYLLSSSSSSQTKDVKALEGRECRGASPFKWGDPWRAATEEMNAAANHSWQLTGSFSKALLAFHLGGGGEDGCMDGWIHGWIKTCLTS